MSTSMSLKAWKSRAFHHTPLVPEKVVYANGELKAVKGAGKYVNRPPFADYFEAQRLQTESTKPVAVKRK